MSAPSEMRVLLGAIRKNGFKVVRSGGGHSKVLDKSGAVVVDKNGPLIISGSPSEVRWREMHVHRLMAAGVLKADPWKPTGKDGAEAEEQTEGKNGRTALEEAEIERRRQAAQDRSDGLRGRTGELRGRLEPIVAKLGGWSTGHSGVSQDDFARVVLYWNKQQPKDLLPRPADPVAPLPGFPEVRRAVTNLKTPGATVSAKWHPLFTGFLEELESDAGEPTDPIEASLKYIELLREMKGVSPAPLPPRPGDPVQADDRLEPYARSTQVATTPTDDLLLTPLAQDALWLMARGANDGEEMRVLGIARRISDLDANERREQE